MDQLTTTKQDFTNLVSRLTSALEQHDAVYPALIAQAAPFDRKLAGLLAKTAAADAELLQYIKSKAETQQPGPNGIIATIGALLLGR